MPPSPTDPELPLDSELPDQELPLDPELLPDEPEEELLAEVDDEEPEEEEPEDELAEELLEEPLDDDDPVLPPDEVLEEEVPEPEPEPLVVPGSASSPPPEVPFEVDVPHAAIAATIPTRSRPPEGSRMMPSQWRERAPSVRKSAGSGPTRSRRVDAAELSRAVQMRRLRICAREPRQIGPRLGDAPERAERLHARRQTLLREDAAREAALVLAERPQRVVGASGAELLLRPGEEANLLRQRVGSAGRGRRVSRLRGPLLHAGRGRDGSRGRGYGLDRGDSTPQRATRAATGPSSTDVRRRGSPLRR